MPEGSTYDWYRRALELLDRGDPGASLVLIDRVLIEDPGSRTALEIRARGLFDSGRYQEAAEAFQQCADLAPDDDYAHYGVGVSLWRLQEFPAAEDHLAMACVMRPGRSDYARALGQVRATLAARREAGLPVAGPIDSPPILGVDTFVAEYPEIDARPGPRMTDIPGDALARVHDVALIDLDGVVYIGDHAVDGAIDALAAARSVGQRHVFVTNNASRTPAEVAAHLSDLGVPAGSQDILTSSQAGAALLARELPAGSRVLAVGGPGVPTALAEVGLVPVADLQAGPVAVMQGFGRDVAWTQLRDAALAVEGGALWVATNLDRTLPVPGGRAPGNGMLVAAVAEAAGRGPDLVAGKPEIALLTEAVRRTGAKSPLVVGDRLDTDIAAAVAAGMPSLLVLTGITDAPGLRAAPASQHPTFVSADLSGLLRPGATA